MFAEEHASLFINYEIEAWVPVVTSIHLKVVAVISAVLYNVLSLVLLDTALGACVHFQIIIDEAAIL